MSARRASDLLEEQALLNDIEESAARINAHSKSLNKEVNHQLKVVDTLEENMEATNAAVHRETISISEARNMQGGFCWMYAVITAESVLLIILLWIGL
eukprot:gene27222-35953_t